MVQNAAEGKEDVGQSDNAEQGCSNVELLIVGQQQTGSKFEYYMRNRILIPEGFSGSRQHNFQFEIQILKTTGSRDLCKGLDWSIYLPRVISEMLTTVVQIKKCKWCR